LLGKLASSLEIALALMMSCSDLVSVRGKLVELDGPLVPIVSALPASVAHEVLLCGIDSNCTTRLSGGVRTGMSLRNSKEMIASR
jgi:hypothetical protein